MRSGPAPAVKRPRLTPGNLIFRVYLSLPVFEKQSRIYWRLPRSFHLFAMTSTNLRIGAFDEFNEGQARHHHGPTSGVGKEIAVQLAALGAEIILACRNTEKGNKTAAEITQRTGSTKLVVMKMDASSQKSIREFASEFRKKYRRLDVLINNAAGNRGTLPKINSVDGIELTFATNVVGYYLLTHELLDVLKKSAPARIVNVASTYASDLDLDDLQFERRPFRKFQGIRPIKSL